MMQKALSNRLKDYASFAASILILTGKTDAEVIYTDIDPDIVLDTDGNYYALDMDGNGSGDFQFLKSTFSINPSFSYYYYFQELVVGPFSQNAVAGISHYYPYPGVYGFFPYALVINNLVDSRMNWQTSALQFLAWKTWTVDYDAHCYLCYWNQDKEPEVIDHFLGVRFSDLLSNNYYGWIRCDVKEDGGILVLKDYAYEAEPEYPILSGSIETYQEIVPGNIDGEIYAAGNTIHISVPHRPTLAYKINILNIIGQSVYSTQNEEPFIEIQLEVPRGIYIVVVTSGDDKLSKEVLLE